MATFTPSVKRAIEKAKTLEINTIAPGHGPVYRTNPKKIMDDYSRLPGTEGRARTKSPYCGDQCAE